MTTIFRNGRPDSPSGLKVAPESYASLEVVAEELLPLLPKVKGERHMLDCVRVLEKTMIKAGYKLKVEESDTLQDCAAFTIPERNIVVFREDIYELLHDDHVYGRSTAVHEMSHVVLQHALKLHRGAQLGRHEFYEDSEWQAKSLTAALMMPISACRQASSPADLAAMCGTSEQAATYRLRRLVKDKIIPRFWEMD